MCGIAGFYSLYKKVPIEEFQHMTRSLSHRGPDAEGFFFDNIVSLGHTRLSILDLSVNANQPMLSHDHRYVLVYNGEVYNFKEISDELKIKPRTSCDAEIILEAFSKWGIDFVQRLNGMFALAIYDKIEKSLYLCRDRMGIKPLFYFYSENIFAFASELKALLRLNFINSAIKLNKKAINAFLYLGYIPEPNTIYANILKFPSGSYLAIRNNELSWKTYWKPEEQLSREINNNYQDAKNQLKDLLKTSVKYRLISDVPYGTFLSGGTDSSLITAIARHEVNNLRTFSIGFKESKYNESGYAKSVAEYLGTEHYEFIISFKYALLLVDDMFTTYDEPFADSSAIPTMLLSKLARQHVKMVLSGDGGDELFFGYGAYRWAQRMDSPWFPLFRKPVAMALSKLGNREKRVSYLLRYPDVQKIRSHIFSQEQYFFSESELSNILTKDFFEPVELNEDITPLHRKLNAKEKQALFDLKFYLKDDLLVKVDRASMKYGLEVRIPLLDYRIISFALNLSPSLKSKNGIDKYLLKEILYDFVPKKLLMRPKWGFAIPLPVWLKTDLRYLVDDNLDKKIIDGLGVVNYNQVDEIKKRFFKGEDYLYNRLWALIILHKFLSKQPHW